MGIPSSGLANGVSSAIRQAQFSTPSQLVRRKPLIVGTYDPALTAVTPEVPREYFSAEHVGAELGFGFDIHRLAAAFKRQNPSSGFTVIPQAEVSGAVAATGKIDISGTATEDGIMSVYVAGNYIGDVAVTEDDTGAEVAAAVVAQWNVVVKNLRANSVVNGTTDTQIDVTEKSKGPCGNGTSLAVNLQKGDKTPAGLIVAITAMASGSGVPDIDDVLAVLGSGDNQNTEQYTDCVHGYGTDSTTYGKISAYDGPGDTEIGNYSGLCARPFQWFTADTTPGSAGLTAIKVIGNARKSDRTNVLIAVPGSATHPNEIAAQVVADRVAVAADTPEQSQHGHILVGVLPGDDDGDDWTVNWASREDAVQSGISTTVAEGGSVMISDLCSFYHPDTVSPESNIYRSVRNLAIIQNMLAQQKAAFKSAKYLGISIVEDISKVKNSASKAKAIDTNTVIDELLALLTNFGNRAWLYSVDWCKEKLLSDIPYYVYLRSTGKGFDTRLPVIFSGEGGIMNSIIEGDVSLAIFQ